MNKSVVLGLTMGDAAGIGPELCLDMASEVLRKKDLPRIAVFGSYELLQRVGACRQVDVPYRVIGSAGEIVPDDRVVVVDDPDLPAGEVVPGRVQGICGAAAARCIRTAVLAAQRGQVDGIVTAPLNKAALALAGVDFPGHTEMLAHLTGGGSYCMMMAAPQIKVCLATTHIALADVPPSLTALRVAEVIRLGVAAMQRQGVQTPRVTVCGLNPHAGEGGQFGNGEQDVILPAMAVCGGLRAVLRGPLPADTAFIPAIREQTDVYVAMYHDQGLIPFKMLAFENGVNVTLGLPVVRTSPDHGTAYDLAWQGKANASSMRAAVGMATRLAGIQADRV